MDDKNKPPENKNPQETTPPVPPKVEEKTLFTWKAPARLFKRRSKEFWTKIGVAGGLFAVILYIAEGAMPVALLVALFFLFYILSTIEPEEIEYKITNLGVYLHTDRIEYRDIIRYWFTKENGKSVLNFDLLVFPGNIGVVAKEEDQDKIRIALKEKVIEEMPEFTNTDKLTNWVSKSFNKENFSLQI
jgi:hypothetical protein